MSALIIAGLSGVNVCTMTAFNFGFFLVLLELFSVEVGLIEVRRGRFCTRESCIKIKEEEKEHRGGNCYN